ncbi:MAG: ABC transporter ATP-binding protein [Oscillospiraceae bacterium]
MNYKIIKRIAKYVKPYSFTLIFGVLTSFLYVLFTLLCPVLIGEAIDYCIEIGKVNFEMVHYYLLLLLCSIAFASVAQFLMQMTTRSISAKVSRDIRLAAFSSINNAPISKIDTQSHGDIISRLVNDTDFVGEGILQGLTQGLPGIATIIGTLIVMLWQSPLIAVLVVLITPLSIFFAKFISKRTSHLFKKQSQAQGELSGLINEMIIGGETVRAYDYEDKAFSRFESISDKLFSSGLKSVFYSSVTNPGTRFVNSIVYAAVMVIGAIFVIEGRMTIGQLSCFLTYANHYTKPFNEVTGVLTQLEAAVAGAQRIFEIIDYPKDIDDEKNIRHLSDVTGNININNVEFSYNSKNPIIKNINLKVKAGEKIAIVGPTGCGKTTLINLLMRFYEVDSGNIELDNIDIININRDELRSNFGMVLQDTWLKNATIKENIAYGNPQATDAEIIEAAKESFAHSFIRRLPNRYDTIITKGGGNLSAGQKQLLCIARIMLRHPKILILDEATSSIDTRTELLVQQAFLKLMEGRTSFVVAHRLSTIKSADLIIVMRDGEIVEQGTHNELISYNKFYAQLYYSQFDEQ